MERKTLIQLNNSLRQMCLTIFEHYGSCDDCLSQLCCTIFAPAIHSYEIDRIAKKIGMSPKKFRKRYVLKMKLPGCKYALKKPCPFLKNDRCSVYSIRPYSCMRYPFQINSAMGIVMIEGIELCPIATLVAEDLYIFFEKFKHLVPETKETEEFNDKLGTAMDKALNRIGSAWDKADVDKVSSEYLMTGPLFMVCFYLWKIFKIDNVEEAFVDFQREPEKLIKFIIEEST